MTEIPKARNMGPKEQYFGTIDASGDLPASCLVIFCMTRTPLETRVRPGWDTSTRDPCRLQLDVRITGCQGGRLIRLSGFKDVRISGCQKIWMYDVRMSVGQSPCQSGY